MYSFFELKSLTRLNVAPTLLRGHFSNLAIRRKVSRGKVSRNSSKARKECHRDGGKP